jgi:hypothetical protein
MGSTISILNDTEYTWLCRVGPDEKTLRITGTVTTVMIAIGAAIATAGVAAAISTVSTAGFSTSVIASYSASTTGAGLVVTGGAYRGIIEIGNKVNRNLKKKGYHEILSGSTYETGKLSLSLLQQATCVSQEVLSPTVLKTKTLYMRRIFSGATHKSTKTYSIKEYLDGKGKLEESTVKLESGRTNGTLSVANPIPATAETA